MPPNIGKHLNMLKDKQLKYIERSKSEMFNFESLKSSVFGSPQPKSVGLQE